MDRIDANTRVKPAGLTEITTRPAEVDRESVEFAEALGNAITGWSSLSPAPGSSAERPPSSEHQSASPIHRMGPQLDVVEKV